MTGSIIIVIINNHHHMTMHSYPCVCVSCDLKQQRHADAMILMINVGRLQEIFRPFTQYFCQLLTVVIIRNVKLLFWLTKYAIKNDNTTNPIGTAIMGKNKTRHAENR